MRKKKTRKRYDSTIAIPSELKKQLADLKPKGMSWTEFGKFIIQMLNNRCWNLDENVGDMLDCVLTIESTEEEYDYEGEGCPPSCPQYKKWHLDMFNEKGELKSNGVA